MHKVIEKTYELIDVIDNSNMVRNIKSSKEKLLLDRKFIRKIASVQEDMSIDNKKKLYDNVYYKMYMDNYYELQLIILDINKRINSILGNKECHR